MMAIRYSKLSSIANKTEFLDFDLMIGGQRYTINLSQELKISEEVINEELQNQPSSYAILSRYLNLKKQQQSRLEEQLERARAKAFKRLKSTGLDKPPSDKTAELETLLDRNYRRTNEKLLDIKREVSDLYTAVRAFEQRYELLKSLNTNIRKTNN
jgi:ABC-type phosphate transport system auxiliary subunit